MLLFLMEMISLANKGEMWMKRGWLPSFFTIANLVTGVMSLFYSIQTMYRLALIMIIVAAFCDVMDGLVARWLRCNSDFGKQLDSLADVVSFGVAPAFLILLSNLSDVGWIGVAVTIVFIACGALRLARFNLLAPSKGFVGMPITAAGFLLALSSLFSKHLSALVFIILIAVLAYLMVSRVPFPSLKRNIEKK